MSAPDFMSLWDYSNPQGTEKKFRDIEAEVKSTGNEAYYVEFLTQLARTQSLQMNFDEAHKILDEAESLLKDGYDRALIRYYLERGRTYNSSKFYDKARELFLKAYELGKTTAGEDNLTIDAAHMMGIVEKGEESLRWNEIAMQHAEETTDEKAKGWLGSLYNNTGWTYHDMGDYARALELFEKNVKYHTERKSTKQLSIAKWCAARAKRSLGLTQEALNEQYELEKWNHDNGIEGDGYINEEIAECLYELGRADEAKSYFAKAYEVLSQDIWLAENEMPRLDRIKELSK
jgi:tetratricopeptide (TPR) repeat protein